eukprot:TRINITY_DN6510_c0_g1_i3.p1 TRINITY_DN6510_c0_g1~~TRINITY_DN6510_c0_g1_i3.p1  ORF type:complete len:199 (-),score=24.14 TRINITY_DN6510_c0_g1_i3:842-1438(-)
MPLRLISRPNGILPSILCLKQILIELLRGDHGCLMVCSWGSSKLRIIKRYDDVEVFKLSFWVQLHSLPFNYFREPIVRMIGEIIGDVQEIKFTDEDGSSLEGIVRLQIVMDLGSFFTPAVNLKDDGRWIHVKYEKLPYICRYCGWINYADKDCDLSFDLENIPADLKNMGNCSHPRAAKGPLPIWRLDVYSAIPKGKG